MEYFSLIFIILVFSIFLSISFKRKIDETIKIGVLEIILIIYITGLFDNLKLGIFLVKLVAIIQLFIILVLLCKEKQKSEIFNSLKRILTPGLFIYLFLCIIAIVLNRGRNFSFYDEFNHWGRIVKNMFLYNTFGTNPESVVTFNEYPPLTAVFQYFFLGVKKVFSEDTVIIAHNIFYFSVIISIMKNINWDKTIKKIFLIVPIIIFLPMSFYKDFFILILVDGLLGILFALALYEHFEKDDNIIFKYLKVFSSLLMLSLIKTTGITLAILALIIILLKTFINRKNNKEVFGKEIKYIIIFSIIITLLVGGWYWKINNVQKEWDFSQYIESDKTQEEKDNISNSFLESIFNMGCITEKEITIFIFVLIIICCNFYVFNKTKEQNIFGYKYYAICMIISIPIFLVGLLVTYIAIFNSYESQMLACLDRYTSTILLANIMFQVLVLCALDIKINFKTCFIMYTIIIFFLPIENIEEKYINASNYELVNSINRSVYTKLTRYKNILDENDSIFYIIGSQNNQLLISEINQYEIMPTKITGTSDGVFVNEADLIDKVNKKEYSYIFVYRMKDNIKEKVKGLFENNEIKNDTLYKIIKNDENIYFEVVNH